MATEAKRREVLQLLREYATWHAAFGSARALDETNVSTASYGPGGLITKGAAYREYPKDQVRRLAKSYEHLEDALTVLKGDGPLGFTAWGVLHRAYLRDEADPDLVSRWREKKQLTAEWHDLAVGQLAHYLRFKRLYPIEPKRLSESEDKSIENKNAEMYSDFQRLRASGMREREAAQEAAFVAGVPVEYVERIVEFRDTLRPKTCLEGGCDREPERANLCMKHYMQERRRKKQAC